MSDTVEVLFATAGVPNEALNVFTEDCLRRMAEEDPRCRYDEVKRQLWIAVAAPDNLLEQMFAEVAPDVRFVGVIVRKDAP
jgi:hypothetical protein